MASKDRNFPAEGHTPDQARTGITRADFLRMLASSALALSAMTPALSRTAAAQPAPAGNAANPKRMHQRPIPSSGEALGVIGCGTWQSFDVGSTPAEREPLAEVLRILFEHGGSVIDSSPMYGRSEMVAGDLLEQGGWQQRAFVATKVWTSGRDAGIQQMRDSMRLLRDPRIELMQIHNLLDWRTHLKTLRNWKAEGRIRYIGITHYTESAYRELEAIMLREQIDFVQLNYSVAQRVAEQRLLPLAAQRGIAVLVNQPFGGGRLLRELSGRPLPGWAAEIDCGSWAQLLLKFVVSHPAVTCAIPGTGRARHMAENALAGFGRMPDAGFRERIAAEWG